MITNTSKRLILGACISAHRPLHNLEPTCSQQDTLLCDCDTSRKFVTYIFIIIRQQFKQITCEIQESSERNIGNHEEETLKQQQSTKAPLWMWIYGWPVIPPKYFCCL